MPKKRPCKGARNINGTRTHPGKEGEYSLPDIYIFSVFILAHLCAYKRRAGAPRPPRFQPLLVCIATSTVNGNAGVSTSTNPARVPTHLPRAGMAARPLSGAGSRVNASGAQRADENTRHTPNKHEHPTTGSKKPLLLAFRCQRARWPWISTGQRAARLTKRVSPSALRAAWCTSAKTII